jgi:hypothetical protein
MGWLEHNKANLGGQLKSLKIHEEELPNYVKREAPTANSKLLKCINLEN